VDEARVVQGGGRWRLSPTAARCDGNIQDARADEPLAWSSTIADADSVRIGESSYSQGGVGRRLANQLAVGVPVIVVEPGRVTNSADRNHVGRDLLELAAVDMVTWGMEGARS